MKNKMIMCAVSVLIGYLLAVFTFKKETEVVSITTGSVSQMVAKEQKAVKTVITEKPSGEKITVIEDNSVVSEEKKVEKTAKVLIPRATQYSLGVKAVKKFNLDAPTYEVEAGYRLTGNLWGSASYRFEDKSIGLGLRLEF